MIKRITGAGWLKDVNDNFDQLSEAVAGETYYVDLNAGSDDNAGSSWDQAFKTLTPALVASHANIASKPFGWTGRNRIFVKSDANSDGDEDAEVEDLEVLASKTDIIGVGSADGWPMARITGNHVIDAEFMGCRFINMLFRAPVDGGDVFTFSDAQNGLQFIGCVFDATAGSSATGAIVGEDMPGLVIRDCVFRGAWGDSVIELGGDLWDLRIEDNYVQGADVGIELLTGAAVTYADAWINRNYIHTTGMCIKDTDGVAYIVGNRCFSGAAKGSAGAGVLTGTAAKMQDNRITGSDVNNAIVPAQGTL